MLNSSRDRERRTGIIRKARQRENTCGAKTATHKNQNITGSRQSIRGMSENSNKREMTVDGSMYFYTFFVFPREPIWLVHGC